MIAMQSKNFSRHNPLFLFEKYNSMASYPQGKHFLDTLSRFQYDCDAFLEPILNSKGMRRKQEEKEVADEPSLVVAMPVKLFSHIHRT
jgi:hypothetical protein